MKELLVFYDSDLKDKWRDSYIKAISSKIKNVKLLDCCVGKTVEQKVNSDIHRVLILEPFDPKLKDQLKTMFVKYPQLDIEGVYTGGLTITAEAILDTIWSEQGRDLRDKTILIVNQSDILGKPLAKRLIDLGANVVSLNSKCKNLESLILIGKPDVLVSASGSKYFKIKASLSRYIETKIDLSNDLETKDKITSIPTVEVLKARLGEL